MIRLGAPAPSDGGAGSFVVPPRTRAGIFEAARRARQILGIDDHDYVAIVPLIETVLCTELDFVDLYIEEDSKMRGRYAFTTPDGDTIVVAASVYVDACRDEPRARWTLAHELGHRFLHAGQPYNRAVPGQRVEAYRDSEWQANTFAEGFMLPPHRVARYGSILEVQGRFKVSNQAAAIAWRRRE